MAFVNTISFSYRFSSELATSDACSYQEVNHVYSAENSTVMARCFVQFMLAAGYKPGNVLAGMKEIVAECDKDWGFIVG
jgi:hypothetical protein